MKKVYYCTVHNPHVVNVSFTRDSLLHLDLAYPKCLECDRVLAQVDDVVISTHLALSVSLQPVLLT